ncbi:MAG: hypothetical protein ABI741_04945 [Ferruginibacter sp.]
MKILPLIFGFLLPTGLFAQLTTKVEWTQHTSMPATEVIYYAPENKLLWEDFKGKVPAENGRVAAITMSGFGYSASVTTSAGKGELNIKVYCFFSKNRSWVKPGKTTAYILNHEQHHFDISYIAACIFVDKIQSAIITTKDYNSLLPRIYDECIDAMNKMQDDYDGQTRNGQETAFQEKWDKFIDNKMAIITK